MNVSYYRDYESMSHVGGSIVLAEIEKKKDLLLCAATGNSTIGLYSELARQAKENSAFFEHLQILKLDEWGGVPENHPVTCEHYLRERLLTPLGISTTRYISFLSDPVEPAQECRRIQEELGKRGPVDVCVLGLGANGHIGFNEPGNFLNRHCHVAELSPESLGHSMISSLDTPPRYGLTLGIQDIFNSRKIILLVTGEKKEKTVEAFLTGKISTKLPASLLWLHGDVDCLIDENVFSTASGTP